jgi:hypothetical protein
MIGVGAVTVAQRGMAERQGKMTGVEAGSNGMIGVGAVTVAKRGYGRKAGKTESSSIPSCTMHT